MLEKKIKDFSESIYNTNQSREFVLNFFDKYLLLLLYIGLIAQR